MRRLLIATKNDHKAEEIRAILGDGWLVEDLNAYPEIPSPEETGTTFSENAAIKALAASQRFPGLVLSDDSGLEVDALDGAPGVYSARYAGETATDAENRAKLLRELAKAGVRGKHRAARFRCVLALAEGDRLVESFDGSVEGIINNGERGAGGFDYDSLFVPDGYCQTFAELTAVEKNTISHRAQALAAAQAYLGRYRDFR